MNFYFKALNHIGLSSGTPNCPKTSLRTLLDKKTPTGREVNVRYIYNRIMGAAAVSEVVILRKHEHCSTDASTHAFQVPSSLKLTIIFALMLKY